MSNENAIGIVTADGRTPIYQPDARWAMWSIHDIFLGSVDSLGDKFVPKVSDWVVEPETGIMYIVTDLNNVTFIPELKLIELRKTISVDEIISSTTENYRVYYDKSVTPYTLSVDGFMRIYSSTATTARIYKGTFIDPTKIISRRYDNNGNFIGQDIPLQVVAYNSHDNYAIKSIPSCHTNLELQDGEVCTVVGFDSNGKVITKALCILEETTYVAQSYAEQKYITKIYMKSVFIDETQSTQINYPVNLPIPSFNPIGVVQYNDGSQVEYPVDGDKFRLYGLDQFVSTIIGHKVPLVLSYRLDASEAALASVDSDNYYVTAPYTLCVSNPNRSYNVKLYVYPVWIDGVNGYTYKAFLMNLDRNILFDVTNLLGLTSNSASFNPLAYGITQRVTFSLDLARVSGMYNHFLHIQTVDLILRGQATDDSQTNIWESGSQVPSSIPYYGTNLKATKDLATGTKITIGNGLPTVAEFVTKLYRSTIPLYNPQTELQAPEPTHVEVCYQNQTVMAPISDYGKPFVFTTPIPSYANVDLVFYKETISGYLKLSVASLTVR
jgi:hypothetical protein